MLVALRNALCRNKFVVAWRKRWLDNAPGKKALGKNAIGEGRGFY